MLNMKADALVDTLAAVLQDAKAKTLVDTLADTVAELEAERDYAKRRAKHWWTCSLKGQPKKRQGTAQNVLFSRHLTWHWAMRRARH